MRGPYPGRRGRYTLLPVSLRIVLPPPRSSVASAPAPAPAAPRRWPGPQGRQLFRQATDGSSPRQVKTSFALQFLHRIVGLEYLNFGIWSEDDPVDVAGLRRAQERLVARLLELLPPGVSSVLDVGCGTGVISERLTALGYDVEGLSPDPYHGKLFAERLPQRRFHLGRFQEFEPDRRYDLLFLCESAQYVWLEEFFEAAERSLAPGGSVLLCDYFTVESDQGRPRSGHPLDEFLARAAAAGLVLEVDEDVTPSVLPTLRLGQAIVDRFGHGIVSLLRDASTSRFPRLGGAVWRIAGPVTRRLDRLERLLDPEAFARTRRYRVMRFRSAP
ncbi:MAG: class I SAM-dependent methyltransferase [Holophagales bacterium]|nr:class I SAM-dependent methyltransferase [Holophagales bacterium]MYF04060.1 class I SAM-dependent methyltransferase [Holophagales bacterium]